MDRAPLVTLLCLATLAAVGCDKSRGGLVPSLGEAGTVSAISSDPVTVQLFWADTNPLGGGYEIERFKGSGFKVVGEVASGVTTYIDTVPPRGTYRYRIRAVANSLVGEYSAVVQVTPPLPATPRLNRLTPDTAFEDSNTEVTVDGSGFTSFSPGPNSVLFGGALAGQTSVVDENTLTCRTPPTTTPPLGEMDVDLSNLNGAARLSPGFTMFEWPPLFPMDAVIEQGRVRSIEPVVCCSGETVHVAWIGDGHVYIKSSADSGATWTTRTQLDATSQSPGARATWLRITCDDSHVYAVWHNGTVNSDLGRVFMNSSTDGGATWLGDSEVGTYSSGGAGSASRAAKFPSVACSGSTVHVTWIDNRNGSEDVFYSYSSDAGGTWQPDTQLDVSVAASAQRVDPQLALEDNRVHVVWSAGQGIYSNSSSDGGATWLPGAVRVDGSRSSSRSPSMAAAGDNVYVAWTDDRNGNPDVYFSRSTDSGSSYGQEIELENASAASTAPELAADDDDVHVVWVSQNQVEIRSSNDGGASYGRTSQLNTGRGQVSALQIACTPSAVVVAWLGDVGHPARRWFTRSPDGGQAFHPNGPVAISSRNVAVDAADICVDGARIYAAYEDVVRDIYANANLMSSSTPRAGSPRNPAAPKRPTGGGLTR